MEALWQCLNMLAELFRYSETPKRPKPLSELEISHREMSELAKNLKAIEIEIKRCRDELRRCPDGSDTEVLFLERLQVLEEHRFQMMSQMNGNQIHLYRSQPA